MGAFGLGKRIVAISRGYDLISFLNQVILNDFQYVRLIIGNQNFLAF